MNDQGLRDDYRWPALRGDVDSSTNAPDALLEQTRADAEAQGYRVGTQRAESELQRMRDANLVSVNEALSVANSLDADLAALLVQCIEKVAAAVVGEELRASPGLAASLVETALTELKTQSKDCLLEVAEDDVAFYADKLDQFEVRGIPDIESPGFRLIHGFARREFRPDELISSALANLDRSTLERAIDQPVDGCE